MEPALEILVLIALSSYDDSGDTGQVRRLASLRCSYTQSIDVYEGSDYLEL